MALALLYCAFAGLRWTLIQLLVRSVDGADAALSRASSPLGSIVCNGPPELNLVTAAVSECTIAWPQNCEVHM